MYEKYNEAKRNLHPNRCFHWPRKCMSIMEQMKIESHVIACMSVLEMTLTGKRINFANFLQKSSVPEF